MTVSALDVEIDWMLEEGVSKSGRKLFPVNVARRRSGESKYGLRASVALGCRWQR